MSQFRYELFRMITKDNRLFHKLPAVKAVLSDPNLVRSAEVKHACRAEIARHILTKEESEIIVLCSMPDSLIKFIDRPKCLEAGLGFSAPNGQWYI